MISRSRAGRSASRESRDASAGFHSLPDSDRSGIVRLRDLLNGVDEFAPVVALRGEDLPPFGGQAVEAAPALAGLLDPLPGDPAAFFQPVQQGVERRHLELQA